jgi:hypothetical protein
MKTIKKLLVLLFCSISFNAFTQQTQRFTKSFSNDNGIYGYVEVSTQPFSWGMLFVQLDRVVVEGYRTSIGNFSGNQLDDYNVSFPFDCSNCFVDVNGSASMRIRDSYSRVSGDFKTRVFSMDKSNPTVGFSNEVKTRHDEARNKYNDGNYFESNGTVDYLNVYKVSGADLGRITDAARKYAKDEQKREKYNSLLSNARSESDPNQKLGLLRQAQNFTDDTFDVDHMIVEIENELEEERQRQLEEQQEAMNEDNKSNSDDSSTNTSKTTNSSSADSDKEEEEEEDEDDDDDDEKDAKSSSAYTQRLKSANERNAEMAAQNAAQTIGIMFILGGVIYTDYGWADDAIYDPNKTNFHFGLDVGFSTSTAPLNFATKYLKEDPNTFEQYYEELNDPAQQVTLNLGAKVQLGVEAANYKANIFGGGRIGTSPILSGTHSNLFYGAKVSLGIKNVKIMGAYEAGGRNYTISDPIIEEEEGKGKSNINYANIRAGLDFSWYGNTNAYGRNHLSLGVIQEQITKLKNDTWLEALPDGEHTVDGITYDDQGQAGYFLNESLLDSFNKLDEYKFFGGFLEWRHDHHGTLLVEYFPKYPHTGTRNEFFDPEDWDKKMNFMLTVSFTRNIDSFF